MSNLKLISPGKAFFSGPIQASGFNAVGGSGVATAALTTAVATAGRDGVAVPLLPSATENAIGLVVAGIRNRVEIRSAATKDKISDSGREIYGRLTFSGGVYILSYFTSILGVETPCILGATVIDLEVNYRFEADSIPADFAIARQTGNTLSGLGGSVAAHVAEIDPHTQYTTNAEVAALIAAREIPVSLSASDGQTVFALSSVLDTPTATKLFINGVKYELLQDYTLSGYALTWLGFRLVSGDRIQFYP